MAEREPMLPTPTFYSLVDFFVNQAYMALGGIPNPTTNEPVVNLPYAKYAIDMLGVVEEKTKSDRIAPETNYLENKLYDLRMTFARVAANPPKKASPPPESNDAE
ncbi:MAG: DUF1844 domain-containing protein [Candidatus Poribacteria bacterium]|nr:DUF1844 domain-containing protein [Candidatus Poribacteria bacterium]